MTRFAVRPLCAALLVCQLAACAYSPSEKTAIPTPPPSVASTPPVEAVPPIAAKPSGPALIMAAEAPMPMAPPAAAPATTAMQMKMAQVSRSVGDQVVMPPQVTNTERYGQVQDNPVKLVAEAPVSTFSIDVDTGSYSNVRRMLNAGNLPPSDAVRVEEMINYFPYDYALPRDGKPFAVDVAMAPAPWRADRVLLRVSIKGQDVAKQSLPPANLVFLVDVSGSMESPDKLPLLKSSLKLLVDEMRPVDHISLVTYASGTQVVLPPTSGQHKGQIKAAIDALHAGGSTAGASGLQLAYSAAQQGFVKGGINRILLATDGDFNVGVSDDRQLRSMVEEKRKSGVSLSTLGFGTGNYNERMMEQLADVGDGAYSYIDNLMEGHKVLVNEITSTLATIAKDVKVQIEFNPAVVKEYRQIGYENRQLAREDFNNDKVDAGDIGAGHTVTALYELTLVGAKGSLDPLRYAPASTGSDALAGELGHLRLRYKQPGSDSSELIERPIVRESVKPLAANDDEFRFATAVAGFGQMLRGGKYTAQWDYAEARRLAAGSLGTDRYGYRREFVRLIDVASSLASTSRH